MNPEYDYCFKLFLIGDSGVGKSSLIQKFVDNTFNESYDSTIGMDYRTKKIKHDEKTIKLHITDTAGQERFRSITRNQYRRADNIIVVYDVTNQKSFGNIEEWFNNIDKHGSKDISKLLVGNKSDLTTEKVVDNKTAKKYADSKKISLLETSSKTGKNVEQAFQTMAALIKNGMELGIATFLNHLAIMYLHRSSEGSSENKSCRCLF